MPPASASLNKEANLVLSSNQQCAACLPGAAEQRRRARAARDVKLSAAADEARRGGEKVKKRAHDATLDTSALGGAYRPTEENRAPASVAARPASPRGEIDTVIRVTAKTMAWPT